VSVSAVLIAHDEGHRLARCLASLSWTDEIVVVVSDDTTDDTAEIARRHGARVFTRAFGGFSAQRQWADDQAGSEWVLSVDCDEVVSPALADEIRAELAAPRCDAYQVPHLDYMFGKWIRHGGWYPQLHIRLYRRSRARWEREVHEGVRVEGTIGRLRQPILHYSHGRVEDWLRKMSRYTTLEAKAMWASGQRMSVARILLEPPLYSGYKLIVKQGYRDGAHGLVLALLLGTYRMVRNLKLWDLQQSAGGPKERDDCPPSM
jgi:glycosyltransferase involved in cell wall biosynthesis